LGLLRKGSKYQQSTLCHPRTEASIGSPDDIRLLSGLSLVQELHSFDSLVDNLCSDFSLCCRQSSQSNAGRFGQDKFQQIPEVFAAEPYQEAFTLYYLGTNSHDLNILDQNFKLALFTLIAPMNMDRLILIGVEEDIDSQVLIESWHSPVW